MRRAKPFQNCQRAAIPQRIKFDILVRQYGRCADCGMRLNLQRLVFDHRPPLALRAPDDDPNDPDRLAAICVRCERLKTRRDLVEFARTKRLAIKEVEHQNRIAEKICGRPRLNRRAEREWERIPIGRAIDEFPPE